MPAPLGLLLRGIRLGKRFDLPAMAAALDTTPQHLRQVEAGSTFPPAAQRRRWARRLGFPDLTAFDDQWRSSDPAWSTLMSAQRDGWIPVVNKAPAGPPIDYEEHGIDTRTGYEYVPRTPAQSADGRLFAVVIVGDSMLPAYRPGDLVVFRPAEVDADRSAVADGSTVFVRFTADRDHGCTVKSLWRRTDGRYDLRPENAAHAPLVAAPWEIARLAVAIERRPAYCRIDRPGVRRVPDEHAQPFPEE
jgi:SOS-response transcriptional repressor LexA